ncbi:glycosyltransferase [Micromonospora sp. DR5-3]|uniref:glycosyltransferase n=1 Tax=unclassified Micromonospora TaxID=2617518 RepID=UPI0011D890FC|nr:MULTISPECIES: glycosyltransferase [unclassified Micromonospora]MCW3817385.1 glycosyltransferase [Micromonospora sp. DR5-3]TYC19385.1 glycosyltransferase family 1 protein [Micromonospora sp. MP36]
MTSSLFVTWDGGGNVPPALGVAAELQRRGHAVRMLGHPGQRQAVEAAGLRFEPYRHARAWSPVTRANSPRWAVNYLRLFTEAAVGVDVAESLRREPTDVAVVDCMLLAGIKAAQDLAVPQVTLMHTVHRYLHDAWVRGPIGVVARAKGMPPARLWRRSDLSLLVTVAGLDEAAALPANVRVTGPVWPAGAPAPMPHAARQPRILISLSSIYYVGQKAVLQSILEAVADLPVQAVLTIGHGVAADELRPPANVEVHQFLPHAQVLPTVSLVVGHAGHSTTMQALAHDLPMVLIPMTRLADQPAVARAVARQGAATVLHKTASVGDIRAAIVQMLGDGPHRAAAARLGRHIRSADGAAVAADLIEKLAVPNPRSGRPEQPRR